MRILALGALAVGCGEAVDDAAPGTDGGAGTGGGAGMGGGGGTGGSAGEAGSAAAVDCEKYQSRSAGSIDGISVGTTASTTKMSPPSAFSPFWVTRQQLEPFQTWAWGTSVDPTPAGRAHVVGQVVHTIA